jgi:hypothetical protein
MNEKQRRLLRIALISILAISTLAALLLVSVDFSGRIASAPAPLVNHFDESPGGFSFDYPDGWRYVIPLPGTLLAAPEDLLNDGVPGPSFTVQRGQPLTISGTVEGALQAYLDNGPLRTPGRWRITEPIAPATLDGRDGLTVVLNGSEANTGEPVETRITAAAADSRFVYLIVTTVPENQRAQFNATLAAMTASIKLLEPSAGG